MKMVKILAVAAVMMFSAASFVKAEEPGMNVDKVGMDIEKKIGVSDEQKAKLKALREDVGAKQKAIADQMKVKKEALRLELDGKAPDRKKAEAIVAEINKLQGQILSGRLELVFGMRAILTPEQYQKLKDLREEQKKKGKVAPIEKGKKDKKDKKGRK